ncbi:MAG: ABC transporter ATP-binding protein [Bacteroidales bacterium]
MTTAVSTRDLARHYTMGDALVRALDGVSLDIARGDFLALVGTSGSGKSTLLNLVAGLDRPTAGRLAVFGQDLAAMTREELSVHRRRNVGMIFQSFNLIATMTALENVTLAMMFAEVPRREREARARVLLEQVGLGGRHAHRPSELSGGEQQRVSIARALANNPEILLADEPTGNLDSRTARDIVGLLQALNAGGGQAPPRTVVLVTHDAGIAASCARRTLTLLDGRIVEERAS